MADAGTIIVVYFPQELAGYGIADLPIENPEPWVGMMATDGLMRTNEQIQRLRRTYRPTPGGTVGST